MYNVYLEVETYMGENKEKPPLFSASLKRKACYFVGPGNLAETGKKPFSERFRIICKQCKKRFLRAEALLRNVTSQPKASFFNYEPTAIGNTAHLIVLARCEDNALPDSTFSIKLTGSPAEVIFNRHYDDMHRCAGRS